MVVSISFPNTSLHLFLNPKESSTPAHPAPHTINFGVIFFSRSSCSFFSILPRRSLIGLVVMECSRTPGVSKVFLVLDPTLIARTSYSTDSPLSSSILFSFPIIFSTLLSMKSAFHHFAKGLSSTWIWSGL